MGGGTIPTPSAEPETTTDGLVLEGGGGDEIPICLLETERTVTTSGGELSAEEGVTGLGTIAPEAVEAGALPLDLPSPFITRATCKALTRI